jgi:ribosomal protein L7Ae-like RNA K-turn-binding protein
LKNITQNLGLCRKAGALVYGFDAVVEAMRKRKAAGVFTTADISPKTLKEVHFHAEKHNVKVYEISADMDEIKAILGKHAGVLAVTNEKLINILNLGGE